jgi:hypothetical protein
VWLASFLWSTPSFDTKKRSTDFGPAMTAHGSLDPINKKSESESWSQKECCQLHINTKVPWVVLLCSCPPVFLLFHHR